MRVTNDVVTYGILIGLSVFFIVCKIPIPCIACEEDGIFTRCISGTGKGEVTCEAVNQVSNFQDGVVDGSISADLKDFATSVIADLPEFVEGIITKIASLLSALSEMVMARLKKLPSLMKQWAQAAFEAAEPHAAAPYNSIRTAMKSLLEKVIAFVVSPILEVVGQIRTLLDTLLTYVISAVKNITKLNLSPEPLFDIIHEIVGIPDIVASIIENVERTVKLILDGTSHSIGQIWGSSTSIFTDDLRNSLSDAVSTIMGTLTSSKEDVENAISSIPETLSNMTTNSINDLKSQVNQSVITPGNDLRDTKLSWSKKVGFSIAGIGYSSTIGFNVSPLNFLPEVPSLGASSNPVSSLTKVIPEIEKVVELVRSTIQGIVSMTIDVFSQAVSLLLSIPTYLNIVFTQFLSVINASVAQGVHMSSEVVRYLWASFLDNVLEPFLEFLVSDLSEIVSKVFGHMYTQVKSFGPQIADTLVRILTVFLRALKVVAVTLATYTYGILLYNSIEFVDRSLPFLPIERMTKFYIVVLVTALIILAPFRIAFVSAFKALFASANFHQRVERDIFNIDHPEQAKVDDIPEKSAAVA